ncbi:phosphoribosylformylglycinamidine synthase [Bacillota bacterium LX-D]|nr:phosphoribosylformylglycinamidine synthase [Bacillota bacterium LX-D]
MTTTTVKRIFVEKKQGFDVEAQGLCRDLQDNLGIKGLSGVRIVNCYDISGITDQEYAQSRCTIFSEPNVDNVYDESLTIEPKDRYFAVEYLPGQYDQRADSAAQCVQLLTQKERPVVHSSKVIILQGEISDLDFTKIKAYYINPVESREAELKKPQTLQMEAVNPPDVEVLHGFINKKPGELEDLVTSLGLAMSFEDLKFCQDYFRDTEQRDPTITEIRVIDTYWSDHCRHTTFNAEITEVELEEGLYVKPISKAYEEYLKARSLVYGNRPKTICLMDIAVIGMKELRKQGLLHDLDESEEINACSIVVQVDVDDQQEEWLVMFKNETHNHPTEIEPFGGAATCLGGAIRDPLSGRSYVYQAMRVTGSGDPRTKIEDTLPGKLPQRKITIGAASGYSSYGNQIGLATGQVAEVYHPNFVAKRMEIGAVIAAAPKENVLRLKPVPGDKVILLGGKTGRDGCGGATGSSKEHTEESLLTCGAEVQKGNPPTERKLQRLFRKPEASKMIKRCNDFGAGGVSVAIGELTDGLEINLDAVPKKYEGLDGTELAISESQERMAVVVADQDVAAFINYADEENLEATVVAEVTEIPRLRMYWRKKPIVDLSREFLNTNGVTQQAKVLVQAPDEESYFKKIELRIEKENSDLKQAWLANLQDLNVCSQKGLVERFDSTIGAGTVLLPFGGKYQDTPAEGMAAKIPVLKGETTTATVMTYGYNPELASWSPFHGGFYAVLEAATKVVALGGKYENIRLTLQEYFEKLGQDEAKWGKPFSALLGAYFAQKQLGIPAIGGKDSMSGTFKDLNVPPTLVAFAVDVVKSTQVISQEFKKAGSRVVLVAAKRNEQELPDLDLLKNNFAKVSSLMEKGLVLAAHTVKTGGLAAAISKMSFGNRIGMVFSSEVPAKNLFRPDYGSLILEIPKDTDLQTAFGDTAYELLGYTQEKAAISINGLEISLAEALQVWTAPLAKIFPPKVIKEQTKIDPYSYNLQTSRKAAGIVAKPRVFIPVFPGTNCEYDSARAFAKAGAQVESFVFRNLTAADIEESIGQMVKMINKSQIIMLPGGFSAGDEPDGSGKFIAAVFRNPKVKDAVMTFLQQKDGLMLGICNGFQALIKLGLVPYGEIRDLDEEAPTLTFNQIGRHVSCMVQTKVVSSLSPWLSNVKVGDVHTIAVSHGEGRFVAKENTISDLIAHGQIATQYVDYSGQPTYEEPFNPNGSILAVEGITSPDGRVFGKMGHSERIGRDVARNIPGQKDQHLFESGVSYFK